MSRTVNIISGADEHLASHRMRCVIPMETLNQYTTFKTKITKEADEACDINIYHKHFNMSKNLSDAVMINDLTKVMFDMCDDWFDRELGEYYEGMCELAHVITCNTPNMQSRIYEVTGRLAQICADPITFPFHAPEVTKAAEPSLLWYGHALNIFSIVPYFEKLKNLTVITNTVLNNSKIKAKYWKPGLVEKVIDLYDIVLIPRIHTPQAKCKSMNRAVDALHAGRFVIAESEEVYGELVKYIFIGTIEEGLEFYRDDPEAAYTMIKNGQNYVLDNYNHKKVCEQWVAAMNYEDYSKYGH